MAIATVAAINAYFAQHPQGVAPGQGFLADYLKPFVARELLEARLDELHKRVGKIGHREREVAEELGAVMRRCAELVGGHS
jgi:hypothetical protein